jgi:small-conductance mechanosensitive channel
MKAAIIEPMKSQGAIGIQGASYQIGVKFTAKPGQQFAVRRRAFIAVSQALEENGIKLFAPQLTINPANPASPLMPAGGEPSAAG